MATLDTAVDSLLTATTALQEGTGLLAQAYDALANHSHDWPVASSDTLGGVKASASLSIDADGTATVPTMGVATASAAGTAGLVPVPPLGGQGKVLTGSGWQNQSTPSSASATTEGLMRFATDEEAATGAELDVAVKPHQVEIIAQAASNAIPSGMTILSTGVGIYRHSSGAGSVIVFGGKQVLVADASYRIGSKTWDAAVSWCAGKTIGGLRCYMPDLDTLRVIWLNRTSIDSYDPTASSNTTKKLSNWGFGSDCFWARLPYTHDGYYYAWVLSSDGTANYDKVSITYAALPCLEL